MMARFQWCSDPLSPHQLKNVVRVGPPLTKLSGSAHALVALDLDPLLTTSFIVQRTALVHMHIMFLFYKLHENQGKTLNIM